MRVFNLAPMVGLISSSPDGITSKQLFECIIRSIPSVTTEKAARAYLVKASMIFREFDLLLRYNYKKDKWLLTAKVKSHPWLKPLDEKILGASVLLFLSENRQPFKFRQLLKLIETYKQSNVMESVEKLVEQKYLQELSYNRITLGSRIFEEIDLEALLDQIKEENREIV